MRLYSVCVQRINVTWNIQNDRFKFDLDFPLQEEDIEIQIIFKITDFNVLLS